MLLQIGRSGNAPLGRKDPLDELAACHKRIVEFTRLAARLGDVGDAKPEVIAEAAESVIRYYTVALPKHAADEDHSLAPLLRALAAPSELRHALEIVEAEHGELDALVARALPRWQSVARDPRTQPALAPDLRLDARALVTFWERHLGLEERVVFPAARLLLCPADLAKLGAEMRARRDVTALPERGSQR